MADNTLNVFEHPSSGSRDNKLNLGGTVETAAGANIKEVTLTGVISDISGTNTVYIASPFAGTISLIQSAVNVAIDATTVLTASINAAAITNGVITINSGGAAGDIDSANPTALNIVAVGDTISIVSDGATTTTALVTLNIVLAKS